MQGPSSPGGTGAALAHDEAQHASSLVSYIKSGHSDKVRIELDRLVARGADLNVPALEGADATAELRRLQLPPPRRESRPREYRQGAFGALVRPQSHPRSKLNPDVPRQDGLTPLQLAVSQGLMETAKLLLTLGHADINKCTPARGTALHAAVQSGQTQMVAYLLMQKARAE